MSIKRNLPSESAPSRPSNAGLAARLKSVWGARPNPVWLREMRQSARLTRTPLILAAVTILITLVVAAVGGIGSSNTEPAEVGWLLYQVFFSLAFAVVSWVGPGVGALTIGSERSGRTWEAMLLTSLSTRQIAQGKFAAGLSYLAMYVVMIAPVGGLTFLFGGVTAIEVLVAYLLLFALSALAVGFGLSISSGLSNPTMAMLVTVPSGAILSLISYLALGVGLSAAAHELWPSITQGAPVWLPSALIRAEFGLAYMMALIFTPLALIFTASWFFYETTAANIAQPNDDRSTGLKRWFLFCSPLLLVSLLSTRPFVTDRSDHWVAFLIALCGIFAHVLFVMFVLAGEPLLVSKRVRLQQERLRMGTWRRFLGPGIERAMALCLLVAFSSLVLILGLGLFQEQHNAGLSGSLAKDKLLALAVAAAYAVAFLLFAAGLLVFVRSRTTGGTIPRVVLVVSTFAAFAGPWVGMAIGGLLSDDTHNVLWLAAPSPSFVGIAIDRLLGTYDDSTVIFVATIVSATAWVLLGAALWLLGRRNIQRLANVVNETEV